MFQGQGEMQFTMSLTSPLYKQEINAYITDYLLIFINLLHMPLTFMRTF